jgi:CheY-like chemotaxis protein
LEIGLLQAQRRLELPRLPGTKEKVSTILVVDDQELVRELIKEILESQAHEPIPVGSARKALELCKQKRFDLVITDLAMPDMDGLELIRALRAARIDVPVLAVSGSLNRDFLRIASLLGAVETLSKPFELGDLLAAVDKSLGTPRSQTMIAKH